jgi:hypothetical protein
MNVQVTNEIRELTVEENERRDRRQRENGASPGRK